MSTIAPHPSHMQNRLDKARRMADRIETLAEQTPTHSLAELVEWLTTTTESAAATWWGGVSTAYHETIPSEATISAILAILAERVERHG